MTHQIRFTRTGGPEVLEWHETEVAPPAAGEVRVRHHAVGLNYIDVYHRSGLYPVPLPSGLGLEAAGEVEAVGPGVTGLKPGDLIESLCERVELPGRGRLTKRRARRPALALTG